MSSEQLTPVVPDLRNRYEWKQIEKPETWRPKMEELVGFYGGRTMRNGKFGQYEVVIVHVPRRGAFMISGTQIIQLVDASGISERWPIRVVWRGAVPIPTPEGEEQRKMKRFEVFVAEGDPLLDGEAPKLSEV